jgi:hypothetical protein
MPRVEDGLRVFVQSWEDAGKLIWKVDSSLRGFDGVLI